MKKQSVVCVGTFDGVHLGHRKILALAARRAEKLGAEPVAVTFTLPPRLFFAPVNEPYLLSTVEEKEHLLKACGIERVVALEFGRAIARMPAEKFFQRYMVRALNARAVVVGYNFRFGKDRKGDSRSLKLFGKERGVEIVVLRPLMKAGHPVSSGRIREALKAGKLDAASALLGAPYFIMGSVKKARGIGSRIGFPTANIPVPKLKIVPEGIYAASVELTGQPGLLLPAVCNIGRRPTVDRTGADLSVETHLLNFSGNLYGCHLKVNLLKKLRVEKKFPNLDVLRGQIAKDVAAARSYFKISSVLSGKKMV